MRAHAHPSRSNFSSRLATAGAVLAGRFPQPDPESGTTEKKPALVGKTAKLLEFLDSARLDPTPENYYFAWEYINGAAQSFRIAVDEALDQRDWLDAHQVETLIAEHLSFITAKKLARMVSSSDRLMHQGHEVIRLSHEHSKDYSSALQDRIDNMDAGGGQDHIGELVRLTKTMAMQTFEAQNQLRDASEQLNDMREKLARVTDRAERDQLTGLPNRWAFEKHLESALKQAREDMEPLSVAFVDIDHFKRINDDHGHETGDRVLRRIAQSLARLSNGNCHVARHGGEEFVILFRNQNAILAAETVNAAREELASHDFTNRETDTAIGKVTFSAGIACLAGDGDSRAMLRRADAAMYRAKEMGRNRVELA